MVEFLLLPIGSLRSCCHHSGRYYFGSRSNHRHHRSIHWWWNVIITALKIEKKTYLKARPLFLSFRCWLSENFIWSFAGPVIVVVVVRHVLNKQFLRNLYCLVKLWFDVNTGQCFLHVDGHSGMVEVKSEQGQILQNKDMVL